MTVAAVTYLGGVAYLLDQPPAAAGTAVTVATPTEPGRQGPPTLVVIGDSYTIDQPAEQGWAHLVATELGAELVNLAVGSTGYVRPNLRTTFVTQAAEGLPPGADVVVVFGGINDSVAPEAPEYVRAGALATFAAVRRIAPGAALIVVGPQWKNATPPAEAYTRRDVVLESATKYGATWLDPLEGAWFADPALIGPDGVHPKMPEGQRMIADRLLPVVADALDR